MPTTVALLHSGGMNAATVFQFRDLTSAGFGENLLQENGRAGARSDVPTLEDGSDYAAFIRSPAGEMKEVDASIPLELRLAQALARLESLQAYVDELEGSDDVPDV